MPGIRETAAHIAGLVFVMTAHRLKNNKIIVQIVVKVFYILYRCLPIKLPLNLLNMDFGCSVFLLIAITIIKL